MKAYGTMEIELHAILSSAVDGCDWSVYNPAGVLTYSMEHNPF
jgi:hypothetical protein